jgi:hypothetical protein
VIAAYPLAARVHHQLIVDSIVDQLPGGFKVARADAYDINRFGLYGPWWLAFEKIGWALAKQPSHQSWITVTFLCFSSTYARRQKLGATK